MDFGIKQAEIALNGEVNTKFDEGFTTQTLRNQQLTLQDELRELMNEGDAAGVMRVQNLLQRLPAQMVAAEIAELRQSIDDATARLNEIKAETEYVEGIKGEKNKILAERILATEEAGVAVQKIGLILYQLDAEAESQREARRNYKQRLNKIIQDAELQITNRK